MTNVMVGVHSTDEPIGPDRHITFDACARVGAPGRRVAAPLSVPVGLSCVTDGSTSSMQSEESA
jgi:hypothetical protein